MSDEALEGRDLVLVELVSRVLDRGVVVSGDVVISVAGVDLVELGLRLHLISTETRKRLEEEAARELLPPPGPGGDGDAAG